MPDLSIIPARALQDPEMTFHRLKALNAIGHFTSRDGSGVWAANATLAEMANIDERDFRRAATWLVERGYVRKQARRSAAGGSTTNMLAIVLDGPLDPPETPSISRGEGEITPPGGRGKSPHPLRGESPHPGRGKSPHQTTPINDPKNEQPPTPPPRRPAGGAQTAGGAQAVSAAQTGSPPLFDRFQHASHRDAYAAMRSAHRLPAALDAALRDIAEPVNGGPAYTWDEIGGALLQVLGNGETFNAARFRGYCRSIRVELVSQGHTPRPASRGATTASEPATVEIGGTAWSAADVWDLCVRSGLTSAMQTREALEERVRTLKAEGKIHDEDGFLSLVLHVQPWALAEIRFDRTREERLAAAVKSWAPTAEVAR